MMFQDILLGIVMKYVPDHFKRKEMYNEAVRNSPYMLAHIPDHFKTQEMYDKVVKDDPSSLWFVPDWLVTQQQIKLWHDDNRPIRWRYHDDEIIEWYDGYKKRKAQKASIKKELMPITWHPSRYWDWCMSEDEKRDKTIMDINMDFFISCDRIQKKIFCP